MSPQSCEPPGGEAGPVIWVEELACLSLSLLKGGPQEDPCTVSLPTGRDRPLPDSSLGFQWPRGKGLASIRWSLVQSCPEGSGQTCGGGQLQGTGGLCRRSSWVSLGHWHEDTAPETGCSSLLGTGEKRGPYLPGHPRKVTSKRLPGQTQGGGWGRHWSLHCGIGGNGPDRGQRWAEHS